jgi:hypothetical protein
MLLAFVLAAVTATFHPASPTVGDLVTIEFAAPVVLDRSPAYEIVSGAGNRVVVRTFTPKPLALSGTIGNVRFRNLVIPVTSVIAPGDPMMPAPLVPPVPAPYPRGPFIAIAIAAAAAIAAWAAVIMRARRIARPARAEPFVAPDERFRRAVLALRENRAHPRRWAALADETRAYLAATRAGLGAEWTTSELVPRLAEEERVVIDILRNGDVEKFAPRGTPSMEFEDVAQRALALATPRTPPQEQRA